MLSLVLSLRGRDLEPGARTAKANENQEREKERIESALKEAKGFRVAA